MNFSCICADILVFFLSPHQARNKHTDEIVAIKKMEFSGQKALEVSDSLIS